MGRYNKRRRFLEFHNADKLILKVLPFTTNSRRWLVKHLNILSTKQSKQNPSTTPLNSNKKGPKKDNSSKDCNTRRLHLPPKLQAPYRCFFHSSFGLATPVFSSLSSNSSLSGTVGGQIAYLIRVQHPARPMIHSNGGQNACVS